jgi:hypothetical protein
MRNRYSRWCKSDHGDGRFPPQRIDGGLSQLDSDRNDSAEDALGEVGLVLVVALGMVLAINMLLIALHVG